MERSEQISSLALRLFVCLFVCLFAVLFCVFLFPSFAVPTKIVHVVRAEEGANDGVHAFATRASLPYDIRGLSCIMYSQSVYVRQP